MSLKSFACTVAACVLMAAPALAVDTLGANLVRTGGSLPGNTTNVTLNGAGQFQWVITLTPDAVGSTAVDALFTFGGRPLVSATANTVDYDTPNPGTLASPPAWVVLTDVDPGAATNNRPVGFQVSTADSGVFAALGSVEFPSVAPHTVFTAVTAGPTSSNLTTSLSWTGTIAQGGASTAVSGSFSYTALNGDSDFNRVVNATDLTTVLNNFNVGTRWNQGNFDGGAATNATDLTTVLNNFNATAPPALSFGGAAVPEPASIVGAVVGLVIAVAAARRR